MKDLSGFVAPRMKDEDIWKEADAFRDKYAKGVIPVGIEDIVEFDLGIEVRPLYGLRVELSTDSYLAQSRKVIFMDRQVYDARGIPVRYRYSLAHEVGHYVLHEQLSQTIAAVSIEDWKQIRLSIPPREYSALEYQAYEFAGRLLVPPDWLANEVDLHRDGANQFLDSYPDADFELALSTIARSIGQKAWVSADVIRKRIDKEGLILP
jgi:hypothetical protein